MTTWPRQVIMCVWYFFMEFVQVSPTCFLRNRRKHRTTHFLPVPSYPYPTQEKVKISSYLGLSRMKGFKSYLIEQYQMTTVVTLWIPKNLGLKLEVYNFLQWKKYLLRLASVSRIFFSAPPPPWDNYTNCATEI